MEKIEFENRLLDAIKKDDLKSFSLLMPTNADLNLCKITNGRRKSGVEKVMRK